MSADLHEHSGAPRASLSASRRASLSHLPTEIKTRIARLCQAQDTRFDREWEGIWHSGESGSLWQPKDEEMPQQDLFMRRVQYRPCIPSLGAVSKEWRRIVTPIRFEAPAHRLSRLRRRMDVLEALSLLPGPFNSVTAPDVDLYARNIECSRLDFAKALSPYADRDYAENTFRRVLHLAQEVTLESHAYTSTLPLCGGPHLKRLTVDLHSSGMLPTLLATLADCPVLTNLTVYSLDTLSSSGRGLSEVELGNRNRCTVKNLMLTLGPDDPAIGDLTAFLSLSLETLKISILYSENAGSRPYVNTAVFPQLRSLSIEGHGSHGLPYTPMLEYDMFPMLEAFSMKGWVTDASVEDDARLCDDIRRNLGKLATFDDRTFDLCLGMRSAAYHSSESVALEARAARFNAEFERMATDFPPNVRFRIDSSRPRDPSAVPSVPEDLYFAPNRMLRKKFSSSFKLSLGKARKTVHSTLDNVRRMADQAEINGDRVQMARIAQALQACEWLRFEQAM
ncbi:hypothetical protein JCM10908_002268 [Rhodotorula pacifica]|uniref:uncharacterized protein n=1 Tax=Rhodotorula pacifica TaxID=1495444 RepID=UPI0031733906